MTDDSQHLAKCALCLQTDRLVKSHVIPKFNFRQIKAAAGGGQYHKMPLDSLLPRSRGQDELQERLLCLKCDTVILREGEANLADLLFGDRGITKMELHGEGAWTISGLNFGLLQHALLSILWRMHISSLDFFRGINLSCEWSETLRLSILNRKPLGEFFIPVTCTIPLLYGDHHIDWMLTPYSNETEEGVVVVCLVAGFVFSYVLDIVSPPEYVIPFILRENGTWTIIRSDLAKLPQLHSYFNQMVEAESERRRNSSGRL